MRSDFAARAITVRRPTGTIIAPPTPWSTLIATSSPRLELAAQPIDESVKMAIAARNTGRAPKRAVSHPLSGISTASVSR